MMDQVIEEPVSDQPHGKAFPSLSPLSPPVEESQVDRVVFYSLFITQEKTILFLAMTSLCFLLDLPLYNTFLLFRFLAAQKGTAPTMRFCNNNYFFLAGIPNGQMSKEKQAPEAGLFFLLHLILLSNASGSSAFPRQAGSNPSAPLCETAGSPPWLGMGKVGQCV